MQLNRLRKQLDFLNCAVAALDQARRLNPDDAYRWVMSDAQRWQAAVTAALAQAEREAMHDAGANVPVRRAASASPPVAGSMVMLPRREDARMDADGHCTVCGCELRVYHGGTDEKALAEHVCPEGFRTANAGIERPMKPQEGRSE